MGGIPLGPEEFAALRWRAWAEQTMLAATGGPITGSGFFPRPVLRFRCCRRGDLAAVRSVRVLGPKFGEQDYRRLTLKPPRTAGETLYLVPRRH